MTRTTRSTAATQSQEIPQQTQKQKTVTQKKRKRNSVQDSEELPLPKQQRTTITVAVKDETSPPPGLNSIEVDTVFSQIPPTGQTPITRHDAQQILDILQTIDNQGLLDRAYSLPDNPSQQLSLRSLLEECSDHPLSVLKSAVNSLLPSPTHSRVRLQPSTSNQIRFCNLALSLLDQASLHTVSIPLDISSIFPSEPIQNGTEPKPRHSQAPESPPRKCRYALVQNLPTGSLWTSLNADISSSSGDGRPITELHTANAELVAILPTPSNYAQGPSGASTSSPIIPTLGSYSSVKHPVKTKVPPTGQPSRRVSCGSFLDYGRFASFAPSFEQDGVEIGRQTMGLVMWDRETKRSMKQKQKARLKVQETPLPDIDDVQVVEDSVSVPTTMPQIDPNLDVDVVLKDVLPVDDIEGLKAKMDNLALKDALNELLRRNAKAIRRLEELQLARLGVEGGGASSVSETSEEWETAQNVLDTLTLLASIRPRLADTDASTHPLIPSAETLHSLHRTLPHAPAQGWYGTLSGPRSTVVLDDTLKLKSSTALSTTVTASGTAASAAPSTTPAPGNSTPAAGSSVYNYAAYAAQYVRAAQAQAGTPYKTAGTQPLDYYSAASYATPGTPYYGAYGAAGQYGSLQNYQAQVQALAQAHRPPQTPANDSRRGTPQPAAVATPTPNVASTYSAFFNNPAMAGLTPNQRAVANTVLGAKGYQAGVATSNVPTLPVGYRGTPQPGTTAVTNTPATPATPATVGAGYQGFGGYQTPAVQPQPAAR